MMKCPLFFKTAIFVLLIFLPSSLTLADEAHGHSGLSTFLGQVLNFIVLFGGLAYVLRKPVKDYLQRKADEVALVLQKSEELKTESIQKLEQTRERLDRLEEEVRRIKEEAEKEALKEKERITIEAQQEAERLRKLAREEIESLSRANILELKAYAIDLSVLLAEEKIKQKLGPELHRKIIHSAIDNLRTVYESSVDH